MLCYNCMHDKGDALICPYCQAMNTPDPLPHQMVPGTTLGERYIIGRVLGEGGFGITYIGYDTVLQITVAIKEYYPYGFSHRDNTYGNDVVVSSGDHIEFFQNGKKRFLYEAQNLARFNNEPGIVSIINFLEENNTAYIIMEYLDGIDLRSYLNHNGILTIDQALYLLMPVMQSLDKIHRLGIIHRDISPDNLMFLSDGSVKLMDFGAARDFGDDNRSMSVLLKQGYAPEEQYRRSGEQGPWTDVYGICATIYRCITGKTPEESLDRLYHDGLSRPSQLGIAISPQLEDVLMYGMAVKKQDRCQSMSELVNLINQARQNHSDSDNGSGDTKKSGKSKKRKKKTGRQKSDAGTKGKSKKKIAVIIVSAVLALSILIGAFVVFNPFPSKLSFELDNKDQKNGGSFQDAVSYTLKNIPSSEYEYVVMNYQGQNRLSENGYYKTDMDREDYDTYLRLKNNRKYDFGINFTASGVSIVMGETTLKNLLGAGFDYGKMKPKEDNDDTQIVHLLKNDQFLELIIGPTKSDVTKAEVVGLSYHNKENTEDEERSTTSTSATRPAGSSLQKDMVDIDYNGLSNDYSFSELVKQFGKPSEIHISYVKSTDKDGNVNKNSTINCYYICKNEDLKLRISYRYDSDKNSCEIEDYRLELSTAK